MRTKDVIANLLLMASTIKELELDNIITINITANDNLRCHLESLDISPSSAAVWKRTQLDTYPWEKSFTENNIKFFTFCTQAEYNREPKDEE